MAEEYGWNMAEKGSLLSGFFYGYVLSQIFGAILSRKVGGDKVLAVAAFFWSLFTMLVPMAAQYGTKVLFLNRVCVGIFEGVSFPVVYHLFALNIPENERSRSVSILSVNVSFGAVFAFYLSPIIISRHSWQAVFYFFGSLGIFWTMIWVAFWNYNSTVGFQQPLKNRFSSHHRRFKLKSKHKSRVISLSSNQEEDMSFKNTIKELSKLLKHKVVLAVLFCHFCHNIGHYVIRKLSLFLIVLVSWLPTFLDTLGVKGEALSITCIPYILMACCALVFGNAADRMIQKGNNTDDEFISSVRRFWTVTLFCCSAVCLIVLTLFTGPDGNVSFVLLFLSLALGLNSSCPVAGYESAKLDLIHKSKVGILQGLSNTFATFSGVIGVPIVSFIYNAFDSWTPVFWWISFMFLLAALTFSVYGRWNEKIHI